MATNFKTVIKPKIDMSFLVSIAILATIIAWTVMLFLFNQWLKLKISMNNKDITVEQESIDKFNSNPAIMAYILHDKNKATIEKLEKQSDIPAYIASIKEMSSLAQMKFNWFNYSAWVVTTSVESSDIWGPAYEKIVKYIEQYRVAQEASKTPDDKKIKYDLWFINSFTPWDNTLNFGITLKTIN